MANQRPAYLTNISNYSGVFSTGVSYEKFDFVFNTGDYRFYYAKEGLALGGATTASGVNRFSFEVNGPASNGSLGHYFFDNKNTLAESGFKVGQRVNIGGSLKDNNGSYRILDLEKDLERSIDGGDIITALGAARQPLMSIAQGSEQLIERSSHSEWESDWFFNPNSIDIASLEWWEKSANFKLYGGLFNWGGPDYGGYVDLYEDLAKAYSDYTLGLHDGQELVPYGAYPAAPNTLYDNSLAKSEWGNVHYWKYGHTTSENRKLPSLSQWIVNGSLGMLYISPDDSEGRKEAWFYKDTLGWNWTSTGVIETGFVWLGDSTDSTIGPTGWTYWTSTPHEKHAKSASLQDLYVYNYSSQDWYLFEKEDGNDPGGGKKDSPETWASDLLPPEPTWITHPFDIPSKNKFTRLWVQGISPSTKFNHNESAGNNNVSITPLNVKPSENLDSWSKDLFFFDADYGSSVKFKTNNQRYSYGNGYYIIQPRNVNTIGAEFDLKFKNRTNREANAIVHFLENHQGQHELDSSSSKLKYTKGISGFRWGGDSTFHPYDSIENQSRNFYCSKFDHTLTFENSNDLSVKLRNLDASILDKSNGMFVKAAPDYIDGHPYEKNDVVLYTGNHQFYYCNPEPEPVVEDTCGLTTNPWPGIYDVTSDVDQVPATITMTYSFIQSGTRVFDSKEPLFSALSGAYATTLQYPSTGDSAGTQVSHASFTGEIGEALSEWKIAFEHLYPWLTLNFKNLKEELGQHGASATYEGGMPSDGYEGNYNLPHADNIGDLRFGMHHIDIEGGARDSLAHAYYPGGRIGSIGNVGGDVHFDSTNAWGTELDCDPSEVSIKYIATHELGHVFGLTHNSNLASIVHASATLGQTYSEKFPNGITELDFKCLEKMYGPRATIVKTKPPVVQTPKWTEASGYYKDSNADLWTRDFYWKPSLGLTVEQGPRLSELNLGGGYTQLHKDGINESLLTLNLNFNGRDDNETKAMLHFLENHYGAIPFNFSPPAPYETPQNFICEEWSHTYDYKNSHSISARFEQFPFNFTAEQYSNLVPELDPFSAEARAHDPPSSAELLKSGNLEALNATDLGNGWYQSSWLWKGLPDSKSEGFFHLSDSNPGWIYLANSWEWWWLTTGGYTAEGSTGVWMFKSAYSQNNTPITGLDWQWSYSGIMGTGVADAWTFSPLRGNATQKWTSEIGTGWFYWRPPDINKRGKWDSVGNRYVSGADARVWGAESGLWYDVELDGLSEEFSNDGGGDPVGYADLEEALISLLLGEQGDMNDEGFDPFKKLKETYPTEEENGEFDPPVQEETGADETPLVSEQPEVSETPPTLPVGGSLIFADPIIFSGPEQEQKWIAPGQKGKYRVSLENVGEADVDLSRARVVGRSEGINFALLGQTSYGGDNFKGYIPGHSPEKELTEGALNAEWGNVPAVNRSAVEDSDNFSSMEDFFNANRVDIPDKGLPFDLGLASKGTTKAILFTQKSYNAPAADGGAFFKLQTGHTNADLSFEYRDRMVKVYDPYAVDELGNLVVGAGTDYPLGLCKDAYYQRNDASILSGFKDPTITAYNKNPQLNKVGDWGGLKGGKWMMPGNGVSHYIESGYFVKNLTNVLKPGEKAFMDIVFSGIPSDKYSTNSTGPVDFLASGWFGDDHLPIVPHPVNGDVSYQDSSYRIEFGDDNDATYDGNIVFENPRTYYYGDLTVSSTDAHSPQTSEIRVFVWDQSE
jgi:phage-related protein